MRRRSLESQSVQLLRFTEAPAGEVKSPLFSLFFDVFRLAGCLTEFRNPLILNSEIERWRARRNQVGLEIAGRRFSERTVLK